ncbi:MAG: pilus assembly protein PilM [Ruminococcus sp.]|nr:pilus assembly protein PilM [Ruminococcus sp.]
MLSFDITDRNIRVVKGVEANGKIKINSAATLNLEEGLIQNGYVRDIPNVATMINGVLKRNKMPDKEAIVSISSNYTIFKELTVPKTKVQDMPKQVKSQMQAEAALDEGYSVTYVVVGEVSGNDGEPAYKVLATACPYDIVNTYREVFKLLGISLKSVMVGCNCITKVLLADTRIKSKMPLLAVQIDNNFISLNLYEQGQLSFSRFASIDADDYGGSSDYVFEAVNENIFRMLQFHRSRNTGETIENVVFYGDTHEYVRLTDELEKLDLNTSLINVPPQIHGHENLEFSLYANAIGAMFKRNKETEKINLLDTEFGAAIKQKVKGDSSGDVIMFGTVAAAALLVGGIWGVLALRDAAIKGDIKDIQEFIDSEETQKQLRHYDKLTDMKEKVVSYFTKINNSHDAYYSKPIIDGEKYDALEETLAKTAEGLDIPEFTIKNPQYADGVLSFEVEATASEDMAQKLPAQYVQDLLDKSVSENGGYYGTAAYSGYALTLTELYAEVPGAEEGTVTQVKLGEEDALVHFEVSVGLNGEKSAYHPEEKKSEEAAE